MEENVKSKNIVFSHKKLIVEFLDLSNVGVSMKVEKASVNDVKARLAMLTQKRKNPEQDKYGKRTNK